MDERAADTGHPATSMSDRLSVLVVEPFPIVREAIVRVLTNDRRIDQVWDVASADEALGRARASRPHVVLIALDLPDMGGIRLIDLLVEDTDSRVLVFSACEKQDVFLDAIRHGAAGFLTKHATASTLVGAVLAVGEGSSVVDPSFSDCLVHEVNSGGDHRAGSGSLARREQEVIRLVADGMTDKEIGRQLYISPRTVQNHLASIRFTTGTYRRSEVARWAVEHLLV